MVAKRHQATLGPTPSGPFSLVFRDVDHGGPSFESRVFINNPTADETTPLDDAHGYVGSFHVYGDGTGRLVPTDRVLSADTSKYASAPQLAVTTVSLPIGRWPHDGDVIGGVDVEPA